MQDVTSHGGDAGKAALPAWSLPKDAVDRIALPTHWPERVTREWALGGSTGEGVRVCILDSGVDATHPLVGELESAVVISIGEDDEVIAEEDAEGDVSGHGTACAGIVRRLAPEAPDLERTRSRLELHGLRARCCSAASATRSSRASTSST